MQCAEQKDWETHEAQFRELVSSVRSTMNILTHLICSNMKRSAERIRIIAIPTDGVQRNDYPPILDTVRVLDSRRLLIIFKGGAEVEQEIEL